MVKYRDVTFFEDGLPPPTFRELATRADDTDKPVVQQAVGSPDKPSSFPAPTTTTALPDGQPRLVIRLPRCYTDTTDRRPVPHAADGYSDSLVDRLVHDVSHGAGLSDEVSAFRT